MVTIRSITESDICVVHEIECQTLSPWSASSIEKVVENKRDIGLVAESHIGDAAPQVVGWCVARWVVSEAELLKISVVKDFRQRGVGRALLKHLISVLRKKGVEDLYLEVRSLNQTALMFYANSGFLQIGLRKKYYANPLDDALILQCTIDDLHAS